MRIKQGDKTLKVIDKKYSCLFEQDIYDYLPYDFFDSKKCTIMDKITLEYFLGDGVSMVKTSYDSARNIIKDYISKLGIGNNKKISLEGLGVEIKRSGGLNLVYFYDGYKYVRLFFNADLKNLFFEAFPDFIYNNVVRFTDRLIL